jgi:hypothetical protein
MRARGRGGDRVPPAGRRGAAGRGATQRAPAAASAPAADPTPPLRRTRGPAAGPAPPPPPRAHAPRPPLPAAPPRPDLGLLASGAVVFGAQRLVPTYDNTYYKEVGL